MYAREDLVGQQSDERLLDAYCKGNEAALGIIMRRYKGELLGFLTRLLGNSVAAEDVFQDTFLQIHLSAASFDVNRKFKPWLFTIAANKGRDYFRKHGKQSAMMTLSGPVRGGSSGSDTGNGPALIDFLEDKLPEIDNKLQDTELRVKVREIIDTLPHNQKEIILLAYYMKLSYNQIAESLSIPLGTVKSRLHSAVGSFADQWMRANGEKKE